MLTVIEPKTVFALTVVIFVTCIICINLKGFEFQLEPCAHGFLNKEICLIQVSLILGSSEVNFTFFPSNGNGVWGKEEQRNANKNVIK